VKTDTNASDGVTDDDALDTAVDDRVEAEPDVGESEPRGRPAALDGKLPQLLLTIAIALVVAAAAVAGWFGVAWVRAANDDSLAYSRLRDEVNRVGQVAVATLNTLDYRKIDQGLKDWEAATTGELHSQIVENRATFRDSIVARQSVGKATVLSSAVRELDERAGKATVMVAIRTDVDVTEQGTQLPPETPGIECKQVDGQRYRCQGVKYQRIEGTLQRTDAGWKLDGIGQVPFFQGQ
jgi:Mce-associated membrane protein